MWLYLPTSAASAAREDSTSLSDSQCQALAASVMWRSKPRQPHFWRAAWRKAAWMKRLSGVMLKPSTAARGVAEWVASLPVSPAPTTLSPADAPESSESTGNSGTRSPGSFARWSRNGYFSKTFQESSIPTETKKRKKSTVLPESTLYLETWPKWGSMRNGVVSRQQPWAPRTSESGGGVWPTPDANSSTYSNGVYGQNLREAASQWPTPRAEDAESCGNHPGATDSLTGASPNVPNGGRTLTEQDVLNRGMTAKGKRQVGLENEARLWATPSARDWKSGDASEATMERNARPLNEQACHFSSPAQVPQSGQVCWCGTPGCALPSHKRKLNPLFTAILMGWPRWWLIPAPMPFARQEMEQWLLQARRRLESF